MPCDYSGTLQRVESVVRVHPMLILGIECRIFNLTYIMVQRTGSHKLHIGSDTVSGSRRKVADCHGVVEGAGTFFRQFSKERVVYIAQFHQCHS